MQATGPLLSDILNLPDVPVQNRYPMDSSRVLLGLLELTRDAGGDTSGCAAFEGVIAPVVLRKLLTALHFRDVNTVSHSRRVAALGVGIAGNLGWEGRHLKLLEIAGLLHDIGKIGVPDNILFKPGRLNPDEAELMSRHYDVSIAILQACRVDREVLEIIGNSRDTASGGGVNRAGQQRKSDLGARILTVADAYDSLRTDQTFRRGKSHEEALRILQENAGSQFDGNLVQALARWGAGVEAVYEEAVAARAGERGTTPMFSTSNEAQEADSLCRIFSYLYLMESLYDGFSVVDSDLRYVIWSPGAERLLGYKSAAIIDQTWTGRLLQYANEQGRALSDQECPMHSAVAEGAPAVVNMKLAHAGGARLDVEVQTVPLVDETGRLRGVAEIFRSSAGAQHSQRDYRDLRRAATRDPLTGTVNRGELESQLEQLHNEATAAEPQATYSVIFADVDHFKQINDRFGHATGDLVLIEIARVLQQETYSGETVGRYGGEEFVILCPATNSEQAFKRAERLRLSVNRIRLDELGGEQLTASFGVAQLEAGDTAEGVLRRADKGLYAAKHGGRNQTRALTSAEIAEPKLPAQAADAQVNDLELQGTFRACTASAMIVYKVGSFITEEDATLVEVSEQFVRMRLGRRGLFSSWGRTEERRPVEIDLVIGKEMAPREFLGRKVRANQVDVTVRIRPVGRPRSPADFEARAKDVFKTICRYFVADLQAADWEIPS
jgi:diguanylate cyclase (GGDEF)-like protein/putative nucleotidyltransferase with HDIG domain